MSNQRKNFAFGMNMPDEVYDNEIPVFIRQNRSDNFVTNLRLADTKQEDKKLAYCVVENGNLKTVLKDARYAHVYPFGMNDSCFNKDDFYLNIAMLINFLYCYLYTNNNDMEALKKDKAQNVWDEAKKEWKELTVSLKWSNLYNTYNISCKLSSILAIRKQNNLNYPVNDWKDLKDLTDDEIKLIAETEHNRWNVEKLLMGFRKPHFHEDK